jgi:hypothetical protein
MLISNDPAFSSVKRIALSLEPGEGGFQVPQANETVHQNATLFVLSTTGSITAWPILSNGNVVTTIADSSSLSWSSSSSSQPTVTQIMTQVVGPGQAVDLAAVDWRTLVVLDSLGRLQMWDFDLPSETWVAGEILWI